MLPEIGFQRNKPSVRFLGLSELVCGKNVEKFEAAGKRSPQMAYVNLNVLAQKSPRKRNPLGNF